MDKSLSSKMYSSIALFVVLALFTTVYALFLFSRVQNSIPSIEDYDFEQITITTQIQTQLARLQGILSTAAVSPEKYQEQQAAVHEVKLKIEDLSKKATYAGSEGKVKSLYAEFTSNWKDYEETADKFFTLLKENKGGDAVALYKDNLSGRVSKLNEIFSLLFNAEFVSLQEFLKEDSQTGNIAASFRARVIFVLIVFALAATLAFFAIKVVKKTSEKIVESSETLKKLGSSTNQIGNSLQGNSESLASAIAKQSSSIHETSAAIDEITSMINRTSENAKESLQVAKDSSKKAEEGERIMERMVAAMETIQESSAQLQNIANIISQINSKTAVINEIVSKTELLSLNASIESARAGEHGKGFAVVAEEVGNLAKVSGKSANEIQALIQSSQEQVNQIIHSTKLRVEDGKKVTNEAQETFQKISENISNMSSVIEQITQATKEQEIGIRQISSSVLEMDNFIKGNESAAHSNLEHAKKLVEQSKRLDKTSKEIERIVSGGKVKSV
jgi:methyl-accepting chemotaxis protein